MNLSLRVQHHAFPGQELLLHQLGAGYGAPADTSLRVDHAVPGKGASIGQRVKRIAYLAGVPGKTGE